jgi:hypothetical protein
MKHENTSLIPHLFCLIVAGFSLLHSKWQYVTLLKFHKASQSPENRQHQFKGTSLIAEFFVSWSAWVYILKDLTFAFWFIVMHHISYHARFGDVQPVSYIVFHQ